MARARSTPAQAMLAQDTSANTTYVALFSPPAGTLAP